MRQLVSEKSEVQLHAAPAVVPVGGASLSCGSVQLGVSDSDRLALLSELDAARNADPSNSFRELMVLLRIAATYDAASVDVPIELLKSALDLAVDGAGPSPMVAGVALGCLTNDLFKAGRSNEAVGIISETDDRIRHQFGGKDVDAYRTALRGSSTYPSLIPAAMPTPETVTMEISELSKFGESRLPEQARCRAHGHTKIGDFMELRGRQERS